MAHVLLCGGSVSQRNDRYCQQHSRLVAKNRIVSIVHNHVEANSVVDGLGNLAFSEKSHFERHALI